MERPLSGVTVLDLGQIYMGGYAGMMLAYMGAEVLKIEPPHGDNIRSRTADGKSPQFQFLNSNKNGLTLNLKKEEGRDALRDLAAEADVLIENFASGTMDRLGVGYDELKEVNPELIYAHGSGYGDAGPYAEDPALDITIQARGGVMHTTGFPDGPPVKAGPAVCDFNTGAHLTIAVLSALFMRERTGEGQYIDVAMLDCTFPMLASPVASYVLERDAPPRTGNQHSALDVAPWNSYEVEDGHIVIVCVSSRHWENLCDSIGRPELKDEPRFSDKLSRAECRAEIDDMIAEWLEGRRRDPTVELLSGNGVPCGPVRTVEEIVDDPQLTSRGMLNYLPNQSEEGKAEMPVPGLPMEFSAADDFEVTPAPELGEHSETVLREFLGYTDEKIDRLRTEDVI
jgi:crotonobetainyl-CoA:carnitine CoA-transferase CaiB-like acyl-CoA transferase